MSSARREPLDRAIVVSVAGYVVLALSMLVAIASEPPSSQVLEIRSGGLNLRAQVWLPSGNGRFPAVLFNHGSYTTDDALSPANPPKLASVFVRHGYVFLWLYRQGVGLSKGQGVPDGEQMVRALKSEGLDSRNRLQLRLL